MIQKKCACFPLTLGVCDVDLRNKSGYTAIMLAPLTAVESPGDMKVIQQLMELGDVNACVGQVMGGISQLAQCTLYIKMICLKWTADLHKIWHVL